MQKRLIRTTAGARTIDQPLREVVPVSGLVLIEPEHRAEHPIDRLRRPTRGRVGPKRHDVGRRLTQPRRPLAQSLDIHLRPLKLAQRQKAPEHAQIPRVPLNRPRRTKRRQPRQIAVQHLDRLEVPTDDCPALAAITKQDPPNPKPR
jgi:hypothetical protein